MVGMNFYPLRDGGKARGEPPDAYVYVRDSPTPLSQIESRPAEFTGEVFSEGVLRGNWETGKLVNTSSGSSLVLRKRR